MPTQKRLTGSFTALDFQQVLLRRMADHNPDLVEDARHALGVSLAQMREANKRWQAMLHSPHARGSLARYRSVLGEPEFRAPRRVGDLDCEAWLWPLPLWPDLRFEVLLAPNGGVWNEWLVRAPGATPPRLTSLDDLTPGPARSTRPRAPSPRPARWRAPPPPAGDWPSRPRTAGAYDGRSSPSSPGGCCNGRGSGSSDGRWWRGSGGDQGVAAAARIAATTVGTDSGCRNRNRFGSTSSSSITRGSPSSPSTRSTRA